MARNAITPPRPDAESKRFALKPGVLFRNAPTGVVARNRPKMLGSTVAPKLILTWAMTTNGVQHSGVIPLKRAVPFKRDVARRIDRVIDYFGASAKRDHPRIRGRRLRVAAEEVDAR